jgi:hypothetical protein
VSARRAMPAFPGRVDQRQASRQRAAGLSKADAALYVSPFAHIATARDKEGRTVEELRKALGERAGPRWWEPHWPRPEMRSRIAKLKRYIVTPETAQHRLFVWIAHPMLPDKNLIVIPREDDLMFGLLHSRFHEAWALRKGSDLEDRPRYTHTSTFATFPFPEGMTPNIAPDTARNHPAADKLEAAAEKLNRLRNNYLYPATHVICQKEVKPGLPDRWMPKDDAAAKELAVRTLTTLYNNPPGWLVLAHEELDAAVAAA